LVILESIVTSVDRGGRVNLAPMGPALTSGSLESETTQVAFRLRPFRSSTTYQNLAETRKAVIHVTDDSLLFAKAAIDRLSAEEVAQRVRRLRNTDWWPLIDCHRWFAVEITSMTQDEMRAEMDCRVVESKIVRPFFGFHRARHAVIEAAILATRTHLIPPAQLRDQLTRLQPLIDKTGGPVEQDAFDLLKATIDERLAASH
jgi:hypothetical protein